MLNRSRRRWLAGAGAVTSVIAIRSIHAKSSDVYDLVVIGAGTAGLPAALFASRRGLRVALIDAADDIGGTLHLANGQVSAAGTLIQQQKGISDSPDQHFADCIALSRNKADPAILRRTVDEAPATINWLLQAGLQPLPEHPVTGDSPGRPAYSTPRYLWAAEEGPAILSVIRHELGRELANGRIDILLSHRVTELTTNRQGAVTGVIASGPVATTRVRGKVTVITSGGYAMNPAIFAELSRVPAYTATSWPYSKGDGLTLAQSAGGFLRGTELHRAGTGSILTKLTYPAEVYARVDTTPQRRKPWEIWINDYGNRFIREDEPSTYVRERALVVQPALRYHVVFDHAIFDASPPLIAGWSKEKTLSHFGSHPMFIKSDSVEGLAAACGIDSVSLQRTVSRYNSAVSGSKDDFGREHLPMAIGQAPFYAIVHVGHSATSSAGVVVDSSLRVIRKEGRPVEGLLAVGEVLGSGATLGDAFVPGMMLTPALALGRWLGRTVILKS